MAAARRKPPEPPVEPPDARELIDALADHWRTLQASQDASAAHDDARRRVVELLHAWGLTGFVL